MTVLQELTITRPDDWHVHLREDDMLRVVTPYTARLYGRALVMPNTEEPILTGREAVAYREEILAETTHYPHFTPVMSVKLTMRTTAATIRKAAERGVKAVKLYPTGATTNSQDGVVFGRLNELIEANVFHEMAEHDMVLCIHGEAPDQEVLDREPYVIPFINQLLKSQARLKIVVEHVSTTAMANYVAGNRSGRLAATVTAHHLYLTLDDLIGNGCRTLYYCMPVVKPAANRSTLWKWVEYNDNFFFGSDSAPHPVGKKETHVCAAGAFTSPIALPLLAQMFEEREILEKLEAFVSLRGAAFYGFEPNEDTITLEKLEEPPQYRGAKTSGGEAWIMPLREGESLYWQVRGW